MILGNYSYAYVCTIGAGYNNRCLIKFKTFLPKIEDIIITWTAWSHLQSFKFSWSRVGLNKFHDDANAVGTGTMS